jgi:hypothetical protein
MKKNLNQPIVNLEDKPIVDPEREGSPSLTLAHVCMNALLSRKPNETISGEEQVRRMGFALRIKAAEKDNVLIDLTSEEVVLLKTQIVIIYNTLITARCLVMLEE